jgi:hypothetical protein
MQGARTSLFRGVVDRERERGERDSDPERVESESDPELEPQTLRLPATPHRGSVEVWVSRLQPSAATRQDRSRSRRLHRSVVGAALSPRPEPGASSQRSCC